MENAQPLSNQDKTQAKAALDSIIAKARIYLYKPIQVAEILYQARVNPGSIDLLNLEDYRVASRRWRDAITRELLGTKSTSSARYQDNLFENNAIPPRVLAVLGKENDQTGGAVEAYIYSRFIDRYSQLSTALKYAWDSSKDNFDVSEFIGFFQQSAGLRRSMDKVYEIVVFALFTTLVTSLDLKVTLSINAEKHDLLKEFRDFAKSIMSLDVNNFERLQEARIYRVGVTNAADRGLDMYSNWGPAIQIKHVSLNEENAAKIVESVSSDKVIIVCKDADKRIISSLVNQLGWRSRIQSIVTETNLVIWYKKALRGTYSEILGDRLLSALRREIAVEFPSVGNVPEALKERNYGEITDEFWC